MVMDHRQLYSKAYEDALRTNEGETVRWGAYRREHLELKDNLRMYQKSPRADILIPMGSKALLPGQLYHTGEVLVSHGGGYFSECSSDQAHTIADRRIRLADEMLQKYDRERELYSDKLELPFISEAFDDGGREIIEPYDEQAEEYWRAEHRRRVRESKQKEAAERAKQRTGGQDGDSKMFERLEEMELLEELEHELDEMELPNGGDDYQEDQLGRLMRGEIRLNSKQRTAHQPIDNRNSSEGGEREPAKTREDLSKCPAQNNNNPDKEENESISDEELVTTDDDDGSSDDRDEEDISAEFSTLLSETKNLPMQEKFKIFQAKLKDVRQRLYQNSITIVEKVDLYQLYEELEEALVFLRPTAESNEEEPIVEKPGKPVRKISFAEHDDIKLIDGRHGPAAVPEKDCFASTERTLFLPIVHSPETLSNVYREAAAEGDITCPASIYRMAEHETERAASPVEIRSILKNKHFVEKESRCSTTNAPRSVTTQPKSNNAKKLRQTEESVPVDIMGEIVEHKIENVGTVAPVDPAPQQRKKVSKFRQQRQ